MRKYFSEVKTENTLGAKSELLNEIIIKHGITPIELLHVGDEPSDINATKTIGCKSAAMMYGNTDADTLIELNLDYKINSILELTDILNL